MLFGRQVAEFSPLSVNGCVLWLRSDLGITKDGLNRVGTWADQSGNGHNVTQSTDGQKPIWYINQINEQASVRFDGSDDYLKASAFTWDQPEVIYSVIKPISFTEHDSYYDGNIDHVMRLVQRGADPNGLQLYAGGYASTNYDSGIFWQIVRAVFTGSSSSIRVNSNSPTIIGDPGTTSAGGFTLGACGGTFIAPCNFDCAEIIGYNAIPSYENDTLIMNYLSDRYALPLMIGGAWCWFQSPKAVRYAG
jgi:hypothetical protein